jgi:hypothetical protein
VKYTTEITVRVTVAFDDGSSKSEASAITTPTDATDSGAVALNAERARSAVIRALNSPRKS